MASRGRTIIMSIHQPRYSIYRLFDTLTLLVSGKMVFHGPAANALNYFANIGDYLVQCGIIIYPEYFQYFTTKMNVDLYQYIYQLSD